MQSNHAVRARRGFTLVELIVTICIIGMLMTIAMPGLIQLFRSGSDAQAYNIASTELANARNNALQKGVFSGVHFQERDFAGSTSTFYCGVVDKAVGATSFGLADMFTLQELPNSMAVGMISSDYTDSNGNYTGDFSDTNMPNFTTLTVMFAPQGNLVQTVADPVTGAPKPVLFDTAADLFTANPYWSVTRANSDGKGGTVGKNGAMALTVFAYKTLMNWPVANRAAYLSQYAQVMPVNLYTGQIYDRK